uniref:Uncharacterized protein n=1 Tax=Alexandrium monilatum TaxID=311494 RepID=A0A6T1AHV1_9DINO
MAQVPQPPLRHGRVAMADADSQPQGLPGFRQSITQKREKWIERADEAMRRSESALAEQRTRLVGTLEMQAQARLHRDILPQLAPQLREYGRMTTLSVFGAGLAGKRSFELALPPPRGPPPAEEAAGEAPQESQDATEYYLRMFARPVLEPFLEGMQEPVLYAAPAMFAGLLAYGASCAGLGFLLGRRQFRM